MLIARVIKSKHCPFCGPYISRLEAAKFSFETYDGDAPENQKQLDAWKVVRFPVVQIIDQDTKEVKWQFMPGELPPRLINAKIATLSKP